MSLLGSRADRVADIAVVVIVVFAEAYLAWQIGRGWIW